ncbi:hypothetical protein [Caulobacter sp. UNC279MFTsu5.1]|uniref:hypothetical protein n=1 Tax=Caulobacter sp. UNC279MFTsu5.1 TaxID=1502775 RepID=UPI0008E4B62F|nr:hypothetical protein [Caulobacter sp. UNC279MFTsu5.1]SFJ93225.1 hypothetical protein SAMN02799626_02954 [Caulobacter sp. UNC279MFTsu5.1]
MRSQKPFPAAALAAALLLVSPVLAQTTEPSKARQVEEDASRMATSPLKDVGVIKDKIPPVLLEARSATYALPSPLTCKTIFDAVDALDAELAPDLDNPETQVKSGMSAAEIGETVVHGLTPMRSWVRKLSGAEKNDNEVRQAVLAGSVRRGFLKGIGLRMGCKPPAAPLGVTLPAAAKATKH